MRAVNHAGLRRTRTPRVAPAPVWQCMSSATHQLWSALEQHPAPPLGLGLLQLGFLQAGGVLGGGHCHQRWTRKIIKKMLVERGTMPEGGLAWEHLTQRNSVCPNLCLQSYQRR